ncbi:uncharacterized protein LOC126293454 isoform X2 [Schistocerca gregaria]|uniref:uncharacterized protein LOC126293454 isoform X2 n=1 Tax=Schistocerca gregaria TaxID=7010 RepID=UPI00211DFF7B|nr:uncharacterized protein LOC126293454 isoform X2 [Schistocerca gregaria]
MNADGREERIRATASAAAPVADPWELSVVLGVSVLVAAIVVALACWMWRNCRLARRSAPKGDVRSRGAPRRQQQEPLSADEESELVESGGVVDVGGAMLCRPPPTPPTNPYENVASDQGLPCSPDPNLPEYENMHNIPSWLQPLFLNARRGLQAPRPPPRTSASQNAVQASNPYPQAENRAGLEQQKSHQLHTGSPPLTGTQLFPGQPTDGTQVFCAEPVATSTPQSSCSSSPEFDSLERAARGSRRPAGPFQRAGLPLGREEDTTLRRNWEVGAGQLQRVSQGATLVSPRASHHCFRPFWSLGRSRTSAEEHEYEDVVPVPTGFVTPIQRESPPDGGELPAIHLCQRAHGEGETPECSTYPPGGLPWAKPPEEPRAGSGGVHSLRRHPLRLSRESGAAALTVPHQGAHSSATTSTMTANSSVSRGKPPRPLPRTSLGQHHATPTSVQLAVDIHAVPRAHSLTGSPESVLSGQRWQPRV